VAEALNGRSSGGFRTTALEASQARPDVLQQAAMAAGKSGQDVALVRRCAAFLVLGSRAGLPSGFALLGAQVGLQGLGSRVWAPGFGRP